MYCGVSWIYDHFHGYLLLRLHLTIQREYSSIGISITPGLFSSRGKLLGEEWWPLYLEVSLFSVHGEKERGTNCDVGFGGLTVVNVLSCQIIQLIQTVVLKMTFLWRAQGTSVLVNDKFVWWSWPGSSPGKLCSEKLAQLSKFAQCLVDLRSFPGEIWSVTYRVLVWTPKQGIWVVLKLV